MPTKIVNIPLYILKNLRPDFLVGWLHVPVKTKGFTIEADQRTQDFRDATEAQSMSDIEGPQVVRQEITKGKNKIVHGVGLVPIDPKKSHLRLVAVDGKIIDPDFQ